MNHQLLEALNKPMTQENRDKIIQLVREAHVFDGSGLPKELDNPASIKLINIAAGYIAKTCCNLFLMDDPEQKWQNIMLAENISAGLKDLMFNPALLYFTQTVMVLVWALMKGAEDDTKNDH